MLAAIYARFSTDEQREASIEDQIRECRKIAGEFEVVATYEDRAISGGTTQRPGYQAMLKAARDGAFKVIVAEDISRLWRNMAEQSPRLAELADLGLHIVTHDLDTRHESSELLGAVSGAMNSLYRKEISRRTKRGLEGKAIRGESTGGKCYGYRDANHIDPEQALIVRSIFRSYIGGDVYDIAICGRTVANIARNLQVPSPRGGVRWAPSTIISMLTNVRYTGAVQWGKTIGRASATDSARKSRLKRSGGPVVTRQDESLRIVPQELFDAVQERLAQRLHSAAGTV